MDIVHPHSALCEQMETYPYTLRAISTTYVVSQVAVEAGLCVLPDMLQAASLMQAKGLKCDKDSPMQLDPQLPDHLRMHSVFVCPGEVCVPCLQ